MYLKIYTTDQLLLLQNLNPLLKKQIPGEVLRRITSLLVKEKWLWTLDCQNANHQNP